MTKQNYWEKLGLDWFDSILREEIYKEEVRKTKESSINRQESAFRKITW